MIKNLRNLLDFNTLRQHMQWGKNSCMCSRFFSVDLKQILSSKTHGLVPWAAKPFITYMPFFNAHFMQELAWYSVVKSTFLSTAASGCHTYFSEPFKTRNRISYFSFVCYRFLQKHFITYMPLLTHILCKNLFGTLS